MSKLGMTYYRYNNMGGKQYFLEEFTVVKQTPKGVWLVIKGYEDVLYDKHFVLNEGRKRYAYETKEQAFNAYKHRKAKQIKILRAQLENAEAAFRFATTGEHPQEPTGFLLNFKGE